MEQKKTLAVRVKLEAVDVLLHLPGFRVCLPFPHRREMGTSATRATRFVVRSRSASNNKTLLVRNGKRRVGFKIGGSRV